MSDSATPKLTKAVQEILLFEADAGNLVDAHQADAIRSAVFRTCDRLRGPLGKLVGVGGFRSLLSRALALGGKEVSLLRELQIKPDGSLAGLEAKLDSREAADAEVVLMAQLVGLLVTFIGPALTLQLLQEIWPTLGDLDFRNGDAL